MCWINVGFARRNDVRCSEAPAAHQGICVNRWGRRLRYPVQVMPGMGRIAKGEHERTWGASAVVLLMAKLLAGKRETEPVGVIDQEPAPGPPPWSRQKLKCPRLMESRPKLLMSGMGESRS